MATVLIAEDDKTSRRSLVGIISKLGHAVIPCVDGEQALNILLNHEDIDVLVTDYKMPKIDGLELTRKIRDNENFSKLPIIMVSAYIGVDRTDEVLQKGVSALLVKPVKSTDLENYISYFTKQ